MTNTTPIPTIDFLNSLGVNTHLPYTDGGYANIGTVAADLAYLGMHQVRDGISDGLFGSAPLASFIKLAQQGVKFTIGVVDGSVVDDATLGARLALVQRLVAAVPGSVIAIEGANEVNNWPVTFNGVSGLQGAVDLQKALYAAVQASPALKGIPVDYFTGYAAGADGVGPNPAITPGLADFDTQHTYPMNGEAPAAWINPANAVPNESPNTGPLVYTESGYSSDVSTSYGVDQTVQAKYTLDLLFDAMKDGVAQTDLYNLMDAYAPGSRQGDDGFGLFDSNGNPKLAATAIHNLTAILADPGSATAPVPDAFAPTVTGLPTTGRDLVMEKSSGVHDIVVWAEPQIWNAATKTEVAAPSQAVTIDLGGTYTSVSVFDPLAGTTAVQTLGTASTVRLSLTDHPLIVEVGALVATPMVTVATQTLAQDTGASSSDNVTSNGSVTLTGTVTGRVGTSVDVFDGQTDLGTATLGLGGTWTYATILAAGSHALHAVATDPSGNSAISGAAAPITVITAPPSVALTSEAVSAAGTTTIAGTVSGASGTNVELYNGAVALGAATLDGHGGWSYATSLAPGSYKITAVATDLAGNTAAVDPPLIVPNPVPTQSASTPAADTLVLTLSEDAYKGDAQFTVTVDGTQVGGTQSVTALHSLGQTEDFSVSGNFGTGTHTIGVNFLNDLYAGTATTDRNLYVKAITLDGASTAENAAQLSQGLAGYTIAAPVTAPDVLTLNLSEDAYLGDAQFTVSVDGKQVGGTQTVTALHGGGQTQTFALTGYFGTGSHVVGVNFLNDLYRGTTSTDRNLYVQSATLDGTTTALNAAQLSQGLATYKVQTPNVTGSSGANLALSAAAGSTLILDKDASAGASVSFAGPNATLQFTDATTFHGSVTGFAAGDTLDLRSIGGTGAPTLGYVNTATGGTLTISDGAHTASLALRGSYAGSNFHAVSDGLNGTAITIA